MEVFFSNLWCLKTSLQTAMSREWRNIFILLSIYKLSLDIHIRIAIANKFSDDMDETSLVCRTFKSQEYLQPHNEIALCLYSGRESLIYYNATKNNILKDVPVASKHIIRIWNSKNFYKLLTRR